MKKAGAYRKILIIKPSSLGDIVHSLPFLNAVKACIPKAEIHWVVSRGLEGLLEGHPMIDRLIVINKDTWKKISKARSTLKEAAGLFRMLRNERYDLVIDLQGLLRSGLIAMATRAPERIGFSEAREGSRLFYTRRVRGGRDVHAVDRCLKMAEAIGCEPGPPLFPFPLLHSDLSRVRGMMQDLGEYAVIVPGARWETKIWPAENFGAVAAGLDFKSIVIGSAADAEIAAKVVSASGGKAVSMAGSTNLAELIELMRGAKLVISNDSGPMHIAAGFSVPVAAVFGPTSPDRTGPYGDVHIVLQSGRDCVPCFRRTCRTRQCMSDITPEAVLAEVGATGCRGTKRKTVMPSAKGSS
ncbi:MAG: lipopolysaccharide heptosyltransferase I [Thermodesulfovibrionales bacterium]